MSALRLFTSESVTEGHPDKICDQISDSILDGLIAKDPGSRVAVETLVTTGLVHVAGEIRTEAYVDIPTIVRQVVNRIGYTSSDTGFDGDSCGVSISVGEQSTDIAHGVDSAQEHRDGSSVDPLDGLGAGDQGIMFGFATNETPQLMPMAAWTAHRIAERLAEVRRSGALPFLRPDGKTQVTLGYDGFTPKTVDAVVLSTQHHPEISQEELKAQVREHVIDPVLETTGLDLDDITYYINPAGPFVTGGPKGDAGLTGRKIIIDTYGGAARHGGGAFSGKDPSKVDRSGAYATRWVARTPWRRVSPTGSKSRSRTRSESHVRWGSTSRPSAPARCRTRRSSARSTTSSISVRRRSSRSSICCARSMRRQPPMGISVASCRSSPGSAPTALRSCGALQASDGARA